MGYRLRPRLEEFACPAEVAPRRAGEEPLLVTVRTNLTFDELDALPSGEQVAYQVIFEAIASYVVAWSLVKTDAESGEEEPVPAPSVAGPDAFRAVPPEVVVWLLERVQTGYLGGEAQKKPAPPHGDTGELSGGGSSESE
jgi:hypothetical protein